MEDSTVFHLKLLRGDLADMVDLDAGELNVPVLAVIYQIIETKYLNKYTNDLYQYLGIGRSTADKLFKQGTVTTRELSAETKDTLIYLVLNFFKNITGRLITKDIFQKYKECHKVEHYKQFFEDLPQANAAILSSLVGHLARIARTSSKLDAAKISKKFDILVDWPPKRSAIEKFIQRLIELEMKTPGVVDAMFPNTNPQNTGEEGETHDNVGDGNNHHDQQESQSHRRINQSTAPLSGTSPGRHSRGGTSQGTYPAGGTSQGSYPAGDTFQGRQPEVHGMGTRSRGGAMRGQTSSRDTNTDHGARTGNYGTRTPYVPSNYATETTAIGNNETMPQVHNLQHEVDTEAFQLREDKRVLEDKNKELKDKIESWMQGYDHLDTKYKELKKNSLQLVTDLESANASVSTLSQNLKESHENNEKIRGEIARLENEMAGLERESSDKDTEITKLMRESSDKQRKIEELEGKVQGVIKIQDGLRKENKKFQDDHSFQKNKLENEIDDLKYSLKIETKSVNEQKDTISTLERANHDLRGEKQEISRQLQDKSTECRLSKEENEQLQNKNETSEAKVAQTQKRMREKLEEHKGNTKQMLQDHKDEVDKLHTAKNQEKNEAIQNVQASIAKRMREVASEIETGNKSTTESSVFSSQSPSASEQGQLFLLQEQLRLKEEDFDKQTKLVATLRKAIENMKTKSGQSNVGSSMGTKEYKCKCKHGCLFSTHDGFALQEHMLTCS